jgi:hypothetical protein
MLRKLSALFLLAAWMAFPIDSYADRNPPAFEYLPSAARTADVSGFTITGDYQGAYILVDCTLDPADAIVNVIVEIYDPASAQWIELGTFSTIINSAVETLLYVGTPEVFSTTVAASDTLDMPVPRDWRVTFDHFDTDSITYSVTIIPVGGY